MTELQFFLWLIFMLTFVVLPIKPLFKYFVRELGGKDTKLHVDEDFYNERYASQLYRPGDRKYHEMVKRSNKAKSIN